MKKWLPNIITLGNLFSGSLAIYITLKLEYLELIPYFFIACLVFDFADGLVARLLGVSSELGKQLDSLADMVSFGLLPGFFVLVALKNKVFESASRSELTTFLSYEDEYSYLDLFEYFVFPWICLFALLIPLFSAIRLAKFNIDTEQSDSFKGLATPANAVFWISLPLTGWNIPEPLVILFIVLTSILMVSRMPLFSLKFKNLQWRENYIRYTFLLCSFVVLIFGVFIFHNIFTAFPIIIVLYLILSFINNQLNKNAV